MTTSALAALSDRELLEETKRLADCERQATARLIAFLIELDVRRLYLGEGYSSLFTYCTQALHLSEHAAYGRIEAARAARRFPLVLEVFSEGAVTLTAIGLLAPHLTTDNHASVLNAARNKTKREVEHLVARLRPQPPVPSSVRRLPAQKPLECPRAGQRTPAPAAGSADVNDPFPSPRLAVVRPLAPERYKVQFTVGRETYEKFRRAQDLLRHAIPSGHPEVIFERALTVLLADLERQKVAATTRPRVGRAASSGSRHIPAAVKRAVWKRDGGQCAFVGTDGRCTETGFLEFHHVVPFAAGGRGVVDNIYLRCRAHNSYEAEQYFGGPLFVRETAERHGTGRRELGLDRVDPCERVAPAARFRLAFFGAGTADVSRSSLNDLHHAAS